MNEERRKQPFQVDEAKFSTQRLVTYVLLLIFACVVGIVFLGDDQAERSTVLQTVINFTMLALGFWLGTSKSSADKDITAARLARDAVTPGPETPAGVVPAAEVVKP
jgi:hypothetical protein